MTAGGGKSKKKNPWLEKRGEVSRCFPIKLNFYPCLPCSCVAGDTKTPDSFIGIIFRCFVKHAQEKKSCARSGIPVYYFTIFIASCTSHPKFFRALSLGNPGKRGTFDFGRLLLRSHGRHLTAIWVCGLGRPKGIVCSRRPTPSNRIPPKFPSILGPILMHGAG